MEPDSGTKDQTMMKVQKGLLLNEDLHRLTKEMGRRTGVSFTRIATAALLQYFFDQPEGPSDVWMEHAVALEEGEIEVGDMPLRRADEAAADALVDVDTKIPADGEVQTPPAGARMRWSKWRAMAQHPADEPIARIIEYRAGLRNP